jgi:tol-pal system protein YbgF
MRLIAGLWLSIGLALALAGCVKTSEGAEMQVQIGTLEKRLDDMEKQNADLKTRFDASTQAAGDAVLGFNQLQNDLQILQGKVDAIGHEQLTPQQITMLRRQLARQFEAIDVRLATLEKRAKVTNVDRGNLGDFTGAAGAAPIPPAGADKLTEDDLFKQGVAFYNQGNLESAKTQFRQFLTQYKKSPKCADAQYYVASSMFKQESWDDSILAFDTLMHQYPQTTHFSEALLNTAIAFYQKGDMADAKLFYEKVIQQFPRSKEADIARKKLKNLH